VGAAVTTAGVVGAIVASGMVAATVGDNVGACVISATSVGLLVGGRVLAFSVALIVGAPVSGVVVGTGARLGIRVVGDGDVLMFLGTPPKGGNAP